MQTRRVALWAFVSAMLIAAPAFGWADSRKPVTLTGVIRDAGFDNPHAFVNLEVTNNTATRAKVWHVILAPPAQMAAKGVSQEMLMLGNFVTVVGYRSLKTPNELRAERIVIGTQTIDLR